MVEFGKTSWGKLCGLSGLCRLHGLEGFECGRGGQSSLVPPRPRPGSNAHLLEWARTSRRRRVTRALLFGAHALRAGWSFLVAFDPPLSTEGCASC